MKAFPAITAVALSINLCAEAPTQSITSNEKVRLSIGDPAPALQVEAFLRGEAIPEFEKGQVYVVEFWATWCAPCIQAMPHLSALQAEYGERGVTIVGVNIRELVRSGQGYREHFDLGKVEAFVQRAGDRMAYTVAYDGKSKFMDKAWMPEDRGLPTTFIVDRAGKIAWIGHPVILRMPLEEIVAGTWDLESGPKRVKRADDAYISAMRLFASDADAGLAAWEQAEEEYPILVDDVMSSKFDALIRAGLAEAAFETGEALVEKAIDAGDVPGLNHIAWSIVNPQARLATRDLDLARRAATAAVEFSKGEDAGVLDTLARVHFSLGEVEKAIELQERAIEAAGDENGARYEPTLEEYRKARK